MLPTEVYVNGMFMDTFCVEGRRDLGSLTAVPFVVTKPDPANLAAACWAFSRGVTGSSVLLLNKIGGFLVEPILPELIVSMHHLCLVMEN